MDLLTFLSEIVKSTAWPSVVLLLVLFLKRPIADLIPLLRKLKYKELELEFSEVLAELKTEVVTLPSNVITPSTSQETSQNRLLQLVNFSTRAAVMEAWLEVESAATVAASSYWGSEPTEAMMSYSKLGEYLLQCKVINPEQLEIFRKLKQLRNKAAHAEELNLSENDARSYVELATNLASHIRNA